MTEFVILVNPADSGTIMDADHNLVLMPGEWFAFPFPTVNWFEHPLRIQTMDGPFEITEFVAGIGVVAMKPCL